MKATPNSEADADASTSASPSPPPPSSLHGAVRQSLQRQMDQLQVSVRMRWEGSCLCMRIKDSALPTLHAWLARLAPQDAAHAAAPAITQQQAPPPLSSLQLAAESLAPRIQIAAVADHSVDATTSSVSCDAGAGRRSSGDVAAPVLLSLMFESDCRQCGGGLIRLVERSLSPQAVNSAASASKAPISCSSKSDARGSGAAITDSVVRSGGRVQLAPPAANGATQTSQYDSSDMVTTGSASKTDEPPPLESASGPMVSQPAPPSIDVTSASEASDTSLSHPPQPVLPDHALAQLLMLPAMPAEVSPESLQRGVEVSQDAVWRLFSPTDPLHAHFLSLPYTFLHLLPTLAQRIERPLHVLVHAHIVGVLHIRLESQYELLVQIQDEHSACNLRFSPAYVEALLGCTAERLTQLPESVKETLYDRLQSKIESPTAIMQLRLHPHVG